MHPDKGIEHTNRLAYSLSTRPDDQNNLTCQSSSTNTTPGTHFMTLLHGIMCCQGATVCNYAYVYGISFPDDITISVRMSARIDPDHCLCHLSDTSAVIGIGSSALIAVSDLIRLTISKLVQLTISNLIRLTIFTGFESVLFILFDSRLRNLILIGKIWLE